MDSGDECSHKGQVNVLQDTLGVSSTYEEQSLPERQWLFTFINGTDFKTATEVALSKFYGYAQSSNAADTIVPISFPLAVYAPFENGVMKQEYSFFIYLPLEVQSPPDPKDPSVRVRHCVATKAYVRTYQEITEDYERLANEFKKDLENDHRSIYKYDVYIIWFNMRGLFQIAFLEKGKGTFLPHVPFHFQIPNSEMC
ncbi:uncharacterized protein LOC144593822 [Rhinoraja longicauda]